MIRLRFLVLYLSLSLSVIVQASDPVLIHSETKETAWDWISEQEHPCNIQRVSINEEDLKHHFPPNGSIPPLFPKPLILVGLGLTSSRNAEFRRRAALRRILEHFPLNFNVSLSSSNALSEHVRVTTLKDYLNQTLVNRITTPTSNSSENWYLFGNTYSQEWQNLTRHYELPPCQTCQPDLCALSFGIGNRGSGVQWHTHGPGFSEALHGRKHWVLYPPEQKPEQFHKDQSSIQWMEFVYPTTSNKPFECTLNPGDLIYFPDGWWHATINLDPYTAFISTFTTEHNVELTDEL